MRDGLYRACEAYANGAITPTTYAVIVSRVDKLLVTLIATEIAGGAFGRQFSAASTAASGNAAASQVKSSAEAVTKALDDLKKKTEAEATEKAKLADLQGQRTAKQQALAGATAEQTTTLNAQIEALARIRRMTEQFDVMLRRIMYNYQQVNLSRVEPSWRTRRVN